MESNSIFEDIIITDEDIDWAESILHGVKFDKCRRDIIKNLDSVDIQACPGSGKTTVLVAKLAILAKKWPNPNRGICVLSHTNVAREEIQERIGRTDFGRKLLSYPHFIGTFHSFFDTFVGIPWIKSKGLPIRIIDSDFVLQKRWNSLSYTTKSYLQRNRRNEMCCEPIKFPPEFNLGCKETANSYENVKQVVLNSYRRGEFTFNEMIMFSEHAAKCSKEIQLNVQARFPILLIDEAQDTSEDQWNLIKKLFSGSGSEFISQGYGDSNQAIYSSYELNDESISFPREHALNIKNSKRFDDSIASIANRLAVNSHCMTGDGIIFSQAKGSHTIFLFEKENIENVITAYAKRVLECFSDSDLKDNERYGCHVIGMVHSIGDYEENEFAKRVSNYWKQYNPSYTKKKPEKLIDYFNIGKSRFAKSGDISEFVEWIAKGLSRYLIMTSTVENLNLNNPLRTLLNAFPIEKRMQIRHEIRGLLFEDIHDSGYWKMVTTRIKSMFNDCFDIKNIDSEFIEWRENTWDDGGDTGQKNGPNRFCFEDDESGRKLELEFGSIHSVKGRTHLSTLVLETKWHEANIKSILPWLLGTSGKLGKRNEKRLKCHYVGLTRAKGLVCIAMPKDVVDEKTKCSLVEFGWNIREV